MTDLRVPLPAGTELKLGEITCKILSLCGRGGSCLVYDAEYADSLQNRHLVRLKEFYPVSSEAVRNADGSLTFNGQQKPQQERFLKSVTLQAEQRILLETVNSTAPVRGIEYAENTMYSILDYKDGLTMEKFQFANLCEIADVLKQTALALKAYHDSGWLHLDIKPENILCFRLPSGSIQVLLFDFDSMIQISELYNPKTIFSCSQGYAAPEVKNTVIPQISIQSDMFSLGCILFSVLMQRLPNALDQRVRPARSIKHYFLKGTSETLPRLLNHFFNHTIVASSGSRFSSDEELISALDKIISASEVHIPALISSFSVSPAYFIGRVQEISRIEKMLPEKHVILSGTGGVGKSTLALQYAAQFRKKYNIILYVKYQENWENTICDAENFPVRNLPSDCNTPEQRLSLIQELCTSDTLLILDNYDTGEIQELTEIWFQFPCQVLVTSRLCPELPEAELILVGGLQEAELLFQHYCTRPFQEKEKAVLQELLHFINLHAMTAALLARLMQRTEILPSQVYQYFIHANLKEMDSRKVRQLKDWQLSNASVSQHIDILFHIFPFTPKEQLIMQMLAVIGLHSVRKELLSCWFGENISETIGLLIGKGWIQTESSQTISLHSLIADRILFHLPPQAESCISLTDGLYSALLRSEFQKSAVRKYTFQLCERASERIQGESVSLCTLETTLAESSLRKKLSDAGKHFARVHEICGILHRKEPVSCQVYQARRFLESVRFSLDNEEIYAEYFHQLSTALQNCLNEELSFFSCLMMGDFCESAALSLQFDCEIPDEEILWRYSAEFRESALQSASDEEERKYISGILYDFYENFSNPLSNETKAISYKAAADRGVSFIDRNGNTIPRTEQEELSDRIEACIADGNTETAAELALSFTEQYQKSRVPVDAYLFIQVVKLLRDQKHYPEAVMFLEEQKNDYNALELAELYFLLDNRQKAEENLSLAEQYWKERLQDGQESPAELARVYLCRAQHDIMPEESEKKAFLICMKMLNQKIRHSEHELASACLDSAIVSEEKSSIWLTFFASFADIYEITELQTESYFTQYEKNPVSENFLLPHLVFQAELAEEQEETEKAIVLYRNALNHAVSQYGKEHIFTAELMLTLAQLTENPALLSEVRFDLLAEKEAAFSSPPEYFRSLLKSVSSYRKIQHIAEAEKQFRKALDFLNSLKKGNSGAYQTALSILAEFYDQNQETEKAVSIVSYQYTVSVQNEKIKDQLSQCLTLSEFYQKLHKPEESCKWLERSEKIAEILKKPERHLSILQKLEKLNISLMKYQDAAKWRRKYHDIVQKMLSE
ncbi:MAG: hypothetical protein IJ642_03355 [Oscillospiraceae bacterium]|nr:hypothetical protein [Oscillospiraceae bacterium]